MQNSGGLPKNNSLKLKTHQSLRRLGLCSPITSGQQTSPIVFPEKRNSRGRAARHADKNVTSDPKKAKGEEHRIDIGDEKSDLLGYEVLSGKLALDKRRYSKNTEVEASENTNLNSVEARLTRNALIWGSQVLLLDDVISVSLL